MAYSLPKATLFWSMALMATQACIGLFARTNIYVASTFTAVTAAGIAFVLLNLFFASLPDINWGLHIPKWTLRFFHRASKNDSDLERNEHDVKKA